MVAKYETYAALRDERGFTDFRVFKVSRSGGDTISDWKNGLSKPKFDKMCIIAKLFCVSVEELYTEN